MKRSSLPTRNPAHRRASFERAYGGPERLAWIQRQPCVISGAHPCVAAHVKSGGMGRKADARWTVPLLSRLHDELHRHGQKTFEAKYGVDLMFWAQIIDARWEVHLATQPKPEEQ